MGLGGSPDPPEDINEELNPPLWITDIDNDVVERLDDSDDDEPNNYDGYEPLPLGVTDEHYLRPRNSNLMSSSDSSDDEFDEADEPPPTNTVEDVAPTSNNMPSIESVEREVIRNTWGPPRTMPNINMDHQRAQEVMSAMANFSLPPSSFPEWAHSIPEDEWKQQLATRINNPQDNR